jgi:hypothetical protein
MNKGKHTPGPWKMRDEYRHKEEEVLYKVGPNFTIYSDGIEGKGNGKVFWAIAESIEKEATARLIAAAPELLEILQAVGRRLDIEASERGEGAVFICAAMRSRINAAIAKAEGR